MEGSSSSKVTVEYHDPSGIFPLISRDLVARLPLRNLNWKSPSRPLRSIEALHVEFVPDAVSSSATYASEYGQPPRPNQGGRSVSVSTIDGSTKERRHQIPGLRQTPYLKLYILRCDDKDTYKSESRKLLREWMRENAPFAQNSSAQNKRESHDAFEWMILHVVIPGTTAAGEPRWTPASKKDPDELAERPQGATKWSHRSGRTVLDKIRSDFNSSGKSALERVAQLRPQKDTVPPSILPSTPIATPHVETPQEQENAWQDVIGKFKILILQSFDQRVQQFEVDIREKDAQRFFPGWNFCTFFTLKEGLARGFESVGLVEDALAIYDELSAGLETAVRDDASDAPSGATFLGGMAEIKGQFTDLLDARFNSQRSGEIAQRIARLYDNPLDIGKKDYRGLIVSSTISLFDFQSYIFSRQRDLLFRLGNVHEEFSEKRKYKSSLAAKAASEDDLFYVADVCKRAAAFVTANARVLRKDLQILSDNDNAVGFATLLDHVSSSWMYSVADQVLDETATPALLSAAAPEDKSSFSLQIPALRGGSRKNSNNFGFGQGANPYPARNSSLLSSQPSQPPPKSKVIYEKERYGAGNNAPQQQPAASGSGLAELAAARAELYLLQRRIIESLAKKKGWLAGWAALSPASTVVQVSLEEEDEPSSPEDEDESTSPDLKPDEPAVAILCTGLAFSLLSSNSFRTAFEQMNDLAVRHFMLGGRTKSAETLLGDHALLKFQTGDYASAAQYFQRVAPVYLQNSWSYIQAEMLRVYASCLKELHRKDEFMRVTLNLLAKVVAKRHSSKLRQPMFGMFEHWLDEEVIETRGLLADLVAYSEELPYNYTAVLTDFFNDVLISPEVLHAADEDGFQLHLQIRHLLDDELPLERIRVRLVKATEPAQEIWLESRDSDSLVPGLHKTRLHSNITTYGNYVVDKLVLEVKRLHFVHDFQRTPQQTPLGVATPDVQDRRAFPIPPQLLLYPREGSFESRISLAPDVHMDKTRSILIDFGTGSGELDKLELRLKPGSAGLRLHTADAVVETGEVGDLDLSTGGTVKVGNCPSRTNIMIRIPYSLETSLVQVVIRLEANYQTSRGSFAYHYSTTLPVELPLDVDVHDIFKTNVLFSKFSIRTTSATPLLLYSVNLRESSVFEVDSIPCQSPVPVFEKQPASFTHKIKQKTGNKQGPIKKQDAALTLVVHYHDLLALLQRGLQSAFEDALDQGPFAGLRNLLLPVIGDAKQLQISAGALEEAILLEELATPDYKSMGWDKVLTALPSSQREGLVEWLQRWHSSHRTLQLDLSSPPPSTLRTITISVDVPGIDIVHTASLTLLNLDRSSARTPPLATVGQPLQAELRISHTRRWSEAHTLRLATEDANAQDFVYTLQEAVDTWLIGGTRRARFSALEDEECVFTLLLIPLKAGTHLLPGVDIVGIDKLGNEKSDGCEVDYKNVASSVLVVGDKRNTSVRVLDAIQAPPIERASTDSRLSKALA